MKALLNLLIFTAALFATSTLIGSRQPPQPVPIVQPKLSWLAEHGEEYDTFYLGSSRTYRQIIPALFDSLMAEAGQPTRSFNLGVDGMRPPEDSYVLEQALKNRKKPLKYVFVECNAIRVPIDPEKRDTIRTVYWHDWTRTSAVADAILKSDFKKKNWRDRGKEWKERWPDLYEHSLLWLRNTTEMGRGGDWLADRLLNRKTASLGMHDVGPLRDGFNEVKPVRKMEGAELAAYETDLAEMREKPPRVVYGEPASQRELQYKKRLIEKHGGKLVLVVPPFTQNRCFLPEENSAAPLVLNFADPKKYPELFEPRHRLDSGHVNTPGAELYTRQIVEQIKALRAK